MITFLFLAIVAVAIPLVFFRRQEVWLSIGLALAVLIPQGYIGFVTAGAGAFSEFHPSSWLFLSGTLVTLALRKNTQHSVDSAKTPSRIAPIITWIALASLTVSMFHGIGGLFPLAAFYIAPALAFVSIRLNALRNDKISRFLTITLVSLVLLESFLAAAQWLTGRALVYEASISSQYWWTGTLSRSVGTFDSPLDLAAFLSTAVFACALIKRPPLAYLLTVSAFAGVIFTGSRFGIVVIALAMGLVIVYRSKNVILAVLTGVALGAGSLLLVSSELGESLLDRFGTRGRASNEARETALQLGTERLADNWLLGGGSGTAYDLGQYYLNSSMENGYLAAALDLGVILAAFYLAIQVIPSLQGWPNTWILRVMGLFAVAWGFAYSSFLSGSTIGTVTWILIGIATIGSPAPEETKEHEMVGNKTSTKVPPRRK